MTPKELQELRARLAAQMRELNDRCTPAEGDARDFTAEEQEQWDGLNTEYDSVTARLERATRLAAIETAPANPDDEREIPGRDDITSEQARAAAEAAGQAAGPTAEQRATAMVAWFRAQSDLDLTTEQLEAARACGVRPGSRNLDIDLNRRAPRTLVEARDLSAVTGASGGFLNPDGFMNSLERNMLAFGGMREVAQIIRTERGDDIPWPTADDTGNTGEQLGESASIGSSVDPTFGAVVFKAYKFSSKLIKVPVELLEDSVFDIVSILGEMLGERLGRIQNTKFTTGTGAATPNGIVTAATSGVTAASGTAITADELLDLLYSVDKAYLNGASFMMHRLVLKAVRQLKTGDGQYLWRPGITLGEPDVLNGYPVVQNSDMSSTITSGDKTVLFGQLSKYKIREVRGIRMRRLVERYADTDQEGFVAFLRCDGNLLDAGTAPVKYLEQA